jgi:hypothetical protein
MKETLSMATEALKEAVAAGLQNVKAQRTIIITFVRQLFQRTFD